MKIIEIIGRDAQDTPCLQSGGGCIQKVARENPPKLVPPFRPWVGKKKIKSFYRRFRHQIAQREEGFRSQDPDVFYLVCLASHFFYTLC